MRACVRACVLALVLSPARARVCVCVCVCGWEEGEGGGRRGQWRGRGRQTSEAVKSKDMGFRLPKKTRRRKIYLLHNLTECKHTIHTRTNNNDAEQCTHRQRKRSCRRVSICVRAAIVNWSECPWRNIGCVPSALSLSVTACAICML